VGKPTRARDRLAPYLEQLFFGSISRSRRGCLSEEPEGVLRVGEYRSPRPPRSSRTPSVSPPL